MQRGTSCDGAVYIYPWSRSIGRYLAMGYRNGDQLVVWLRKSFTLLQVIRIIAQTYFCNPLSPLRSRASISRFVLRYRSTVTTLFYHNPHRCAPTNQIFSTLRYDFRSSHFPLKFSVGQSYYKCKKTVVL